MLEVCDELGYPVFIVTKSDLVQNDINVLSSLATRNLVAVNFTVTPVKAKVLTKLEPHAPSNQRRLEAMKKLTQAKIPCNEYSSPIFPKLSDGLLNHFVREASGILVMPTSNPFFNRFFLNSAIAGRGKVMVYQDDNCGQPPAQGDCGCITYGPGSPSVVMPRCSPLETVYRKDLAARATHAPLNSLLARK